MTDHAASPATACVGRIVVHAGNDPQAAQRLVARLPSVLGSELAKHEMADRGDVERLVRDAAREARA